MKAFSAITRRYAALDCRAQDIFIVDDRDEFAPVDGECLDGVFVFAEAQVVVLLSTHQAVPALFA